MSEFLTNTEINQFNKDGAIFLKGKFDVNWIEKLKSEGTTCVFITHNLHHVYPVSDRLIVFARGEKIADVYKKDTSIEELTRMITDD